MLHRMRLHVCSKVYVDKRADADDEYDDYDDGDLSARVSCLHQWNSRVAQCSFVLIKSFVTAMG